MRRAPAPLLPLALLLLLAGTMVVSLALGALRLPIPDVLRALTGTGDPLTQQILFDLRAPRVVVAALTGAMFAVSGALMQGVVRNPLASPDIIGVGAGAGLAVTILMLAAPGAPAWTLPWGAFLGAWTGFLATAALARERGQLNPVRLALVGIAVAAAFGAARELIIVRAPDGIGGAIAFLSGTVYGADWDRVWRVLPWAALLPVSLLIARRLDVLSFGEGVATSLGERVGLLRGVALTIAVALAGSAIVGAGILGFVGLVAPHLARLLVGSLHARLIPASLLIGAILVVVADTLGRSILPPLEIPAGIITTLIGAPYFLYLLRRH